MCGLKQFRELIHNTSYYVTPCVGVWIETFTDKEKEYILQSHPAWVCGLKHYMSNIEDTIYKSHPAWVCGLKQIIKLPMNFWNHCHTLRGCVDWNSNCLLNTVFDTVTPCVGVWIETIFNWNDKPLHKSHPAWVCGLKLLFNRVHNNDKAVTPCVGVWIETISAELENRAKSGHTLRGCVDWNWRLRAVTDCIPRSHPAWVCGLKHLPYTGLVRFPSSHPAWVCGLKPIEEVMRKQLRKSHPAWVCGLKLQWGWCLPML